MTAIERTFWIHLGLGAGALALGYGLARQVGAALAIILLGGLWFAMQRADREVGGLMLLLACGAAAVGVLAGVSGVALLIGVVGCLGAWDLDHFLSRLAAAERVDYETGLGREHVRRLLAIEGVGLVAGLFALTAQARISFWWEALLALLAVIGISRMVAFIRKQSGQ
jgi:hypothetical protein